MKAPKRIEENKKNMPKELLEESKKVKDILFDKTIDTAKANAIIDDFNRRWLAAGGLHGACISNRK